MVTDQQIKRLFKLEKTELTRALAAAKAGVCEKTARKYSKAGKLPSQMKQDRTHRTRKDPFEAVWPEIEGMLRLDEGLLATTIFDYLHRRAPGQFQEGQLRTLQRQIKAWRAVEGPAKEVFFPQERRPGVQCQSDFTCMNSLGVMIADQPYDHIFYHFVLPYSNWEWGEVCYSETLEALRAGLQNALWRLGAVPGEHRTDNLGAAINNFQGRKEFNASYQGLVDHYRIKPTRNYPGNSHENGSVEQSHHRFKLAVGQNLILRGSRNFQTREAYQEFLQEIMIKRNKTRSERFSEEVKTLRELPDRRLEDYTETAPVNVTRFSTISVRKNVYSVDSRLIGSKVKVRVYGDKLEVWYNSKCVLCMPRLRGKGGHAINYRHIAHSLAKKPGAFAEYKYRSDLFPRFMFRVAYDWLGENVVKADAHYVKILLLAANEGEERVDRVIRYLIKHGKPLTHNIVAAKVNEDIPSEGITMRKPVADLAAYDNLLEATDAG